MEEEFMKDWSALIGDSDGTTSYKFLLEGVQFSVHELFWAVAALGGLAKLGKWKDVGNEMMMRKTGTMVSAAPGKNYGLIKNQWERWHLSRLEEAHASRPVPDAYLAPVVDPKRKAEPQASKAGEASLASPQGTATADAKTHWKGRKMLSRKALAADLPSEAEQPYPPYPRASGTLSPVTLSSSSPHPHAPLPTLPNLPPLPPLPELSKEEKFHLRLSQSATYVRGLRKDELAVKRRLDDAFRQRCDIHRFRTDALGQDRFYRRYWVLGDDFSRVWVEKPEQAGEHGGGEEVEWGCYSRVEELDALIRALDPHGIREGALREALELLRDALASEMTKPNKAAAVLESYPQPPPPDDAPPLPPSEPATTEEGGGPSGAEPDPPPAPQMHPLRLLHSEIVTYAERYYSLKTAPSDPTPERSQFVLEQSLFKGEASGAAARAFFGIPDALCSPDGAAGASVVSGGLCKLKGDLLLIAQALSLSAGALAEGFEEQRLAWLRSVRDAQAAAEVDEALSALSAHVADRFLQDWYDFVPRQPAAVEPMEEDEEGEGGEGEGAERKEGEGREGGGEGEARGVRGIAEVAGDPMTVAVVGLRVYGLDEALLYDGGRATPRKGSVKKKK